MNDATPSMSDADFVERMASPTPKMSLGMIDPLSEIGSHAVKDSVEVVATRELGQLWHVGLPISIIKKAGESYTYLSFKTRAAII